MKFVKRLLYITFAIILISIGVNMFLAPHDIAAGGITGLAIILEAYMGLDRSMVILVSNAIVLVVTFIFLGREIFLNTVIGASMLPLVIGIVPRIDLVEDTMIAVIVGSVLFGVAVHILYANKASSGGTAVPPLIFQKYFKLNPAIGLFLTDGVVVALCLLVFPVDNFFFAVLSIFITSATMRYLEDGINKKKMVYIISEKNDLITQDILHEVGRGVTIIPAQGAYKQNEMNMLMVTCHAKDYRLLVEVVDRHDKEAFMITDTVSDVHGKGFSYQSGTV